MKAVTGAIIIEGHVQGLSNTRALGEKGIPVYVVDKTRCIASYSRYCTKFFHCPDFLSDEFPQFLVDLAERENIRGWVLIPSNDHAVYGISRHKPLLQNYFSIITPGLEIIDNIYDKSRLLQTAEAIGVPVPATQYFLSAEDPVSDRLTFPLLTKGRHGLSFYRAVGKAALLARDENELRRHLRMIEEKYFIAGSFTQEVIPSHNNNKTISFTAFCTDGEIRTSWMGVKLREHPLQFGTGTYAGSLWIRECYDQSARLLKALNYTGVCEVEYLRDPASGEYKLIEINARTWLWVGLAKFCGVDYAAMIYDYMTGKEPDFPGKYDVDRYWINPVSDTMYSIIAILKGKLKVTEYLATFRRKTVNALFSANDPRPGFAYLFKMVSFLAKR
ncbi:MAG: hypothetical protein KBC43_01320 [Bacteroidales bacterium]|nr:hypothetical protein [Bacteroidales bacterium]